MTEPLSAHSKPTDRPDAHCADCPFADRGDWVMYRDEYEQLVNGRIRAIEQRENANAVSARVEVENRRLREAIQEAVACLNHGEADAAQVVLEHA